MNRNEIIKMAKASGFDAIGFIDPKEMKFLQEVRDMCAANSCKKYGTCWTCPPGCGTLESISNRAKTFGICAVVQTVGALEDPFDFEGMMAAEEIQKSRFNKLIKAVSVMGNQFLPMATGSCQLCETCTYPNEPCRFPERAFPSMESYGLLVNDICNDAGLKYYHGPGTVTYTACILFK